MPVKVQSDGRAQFSAYVFDLKTGDLTRSGIRRRLERQPAKVLALLVEAQGGLVSRSELIAALWPGEIEGDFDRRLDKAIAKLRASLNDDPTKPRYIETLKGRGYRFLDAITMEESSSSQELAVPPVERPPSVDKCGSRQSPQEISGESSLVSLWTPLSQVSIFADSHHYRRRSSSVCTRLVAARKIRHSRSQPSGSTGPGIPGCLELI